MLLKFKDKENVFRSGGKHIQIKPARTKLIKVLDPIRRRSKARQKQLHESP